MAASDLDALPEELRSVGADAGRHSANVTVPTRTLAAPVRDRTCAVRCFITHENDKSRQETADSGRGVLELRVGRTQRCLGGAGAPPPVEAVRLSRAAFQSQNARVDELLWRAKSSSAGWSAMLASETWKARTRNETRDRSALFGGRCEPSSWQVQEGLAAEWSKANRRELHSSLDESWCSIHAER